MISLTSRIASLERLVSAKRTLVPLERQAWRLDAKNGDGGLPALVTIQF